eukprot:9412005-Pyramimonas_sp.AAC.1
MCPLERRPEATLQSQPAGSAIRDPGSESGAGGLFALLCTYMKRCVPKVCVAEAGEQSGSRPENNR